MCTDIKFLRAAAFKSAGNLVALWLLSFSIISGVAPFTNLLSPNLLRIRA
jgi:hypothetical protein